MRTQGTQWDVKLENRPRNIHRLAEQRKEAVNSQASEYLMTPANVQGNMTVIKRPNSVGVPIQHISVVDDLGHEIDDLLEERF